VLLGTLVEKVLLRLYFSVMQTTVVCGQLGSGKTTFIQNILRHANARTVVLVNDFGKLGIDGEIISSAGIDTIELPSGCVCCTLLLL
jgi:G3E family GTPase